MKIEITSKNYDISQNLKDIIEKKVKKLDKYFTDTASVKVNCRKENNLCKLELNVRSKGLFYRAEVTGDNMYENIDLALPKVEKQIVKYGEKFTQSFRRGALASKDYLFLDEFKEDKKKDTIVKRKTYELEPISVEDAQMFLDNIDNTFYVFLNQETNMVNVIYKRLDGGYGLIETVY